MAEESFLPNRLSESIWLFLLPLLGTYVAFLFQIGYLGYFGVPASMIEVDIPKIVSSMVAIVITAVIFVGIFTFVGALLVSKNPIFRIAGKGLFVLVILLPLMLNSALSTKEFIVCGILLLLAWLTMFIPPSQTAGEKRSYTQRLTEQEDQYDRTPKDKPNNITLGAIILLTLAIYVPTLGALCARISGGGNTYLKSNPNALYIGRVDGSYIFTVVDPSTNTFSDHILLVGSGEPIEFVNNTRHATKQEPSN